MKIVIRGQGPRVMSTRSIIKMKFGLNFTDLHSSQKKGNFRKVSFGEECIGSIRKFRKEQGAKKNDKGAGSILG